MSQIQLAVLGVALALLTGCRSSIPPVDDGEAESLEGSWEVTSVQREGGPDLIQVGARITFTGQEVQFQPKAVQFADGTSWTLMLTEPREALPRSSTYALTAGRPARIDLTTVSQDNPTGLYTQGIYLLQGDVLRYCIAAPGRPRPTEFATTKEDGYTLVVLRRIAVDRR